MATPAEAAQAAAQAAQAALELAVGPLLVMLCLAFMCVALSLRSYVRVANPAHCSLYGVFLAQTYYYYVNYGSDSWKLKTYVAVIA